jgi:hypothetical protein
MLIRKIQKNKKNQIYKKRKKLRDKFGNLTIFLPINSSLQYTQKGGVILHIWGGNTNKTLNLNPSLPNQPPPTHPAACSSSSLSAVPSTLTQATAPFPSQNQRNKASPGHLSPPIFPPA